MIFAYCGPSQHTGLGHIFPLAEPLATEIWDPHGSEKRTFQSLPTQTPHMVKPGKKEGPGLQSSQAPGPRAVASISLCPIEVRMCS